MPVTGKEYKLAIKIAGMVDKSFNTSLAAADTKLKRFQNLTNRLEGDFSRLDNGFDKIMNIGQKCFSVIAVAAGAAVTAVGAVTAASVAVGSEFESAFTGVKKTVDATEQQYAKLRDDILEMTRTIPEGAAEVAAVMEVAGQLGIATDSLTDFTTTIINLGMSTNLSAEEGAASLAKFANIVGMADYDEKGISNWERLGSVIVDLGNNFATTEADIVNMSTRLASTGNLVGLSEAQILALSTAMSSVGIESEVGGSTMSKLLKKMQLAVELAPTSKKDLDKLDDFEGIKGFAAVANTSVNEFREIFAEDAVTAMALFIDGLDDVERNGKSAIAIMDEMDLDEIRLSNTIMALANADGVMSAAVQTARNAWEENTALVEEAGKRYETAESKVQIMKNAVREVGITAYDNLREPFVGAVEAITGKVQEFNDYIGRADGLGKWLQDAQTQFPTFQRKFKKFAQPVFAGITGAGKWIVKHGKGIISTLAGIGGALTAYKIASGISHTATAILSLGSLSPVTLGIMGTASAVGVLIGAFAAYKQQERELIDRNLAEHFGSIALSMEDIQKVAEYIVGSESLSGVQKALEAFEDLDGISAEMQNAVSELDKLNWKISIGMELTADENEAYKQAINSYVATAQEYAMQSQYAVALNLQIAFSEEDAEGSSIVSKVNQFYQDKYGELSALGTQLNNAITDAFNDGLLDIKETQVIADIQRKMAEIEESLAMGELDARLSVLGMTYAGGGSLKKESFQNMQGELATRSSEIMETYQESYVKNLAAIQAAYHAGDYLDEAEYLSARESLDAHHLENVMNAQTKLTGFQTDTVMNQYAEEIAFAVPKYWNAVQETIAKYAAGTELYNEWHANPEALWSAMITDLYGRGIFSEDSKENRIDKKAISELIETMQPSVEELARVKKQYEELGREAPQYVVKGLSDYALLDALANDSEASIGYLLGTALSGSDSYDSFYKEFVENMADYAPESILTGVGDCVPESIADILGTAKGIIQPAVEGMYAWSQETLDASFSRDFEVSAGVKIALSPEVQFTHKDYLLGIGKTFSYPIDRNANGGIIRNKELSWLAERGPEAVIPLDGSENAVSLWEKTGQLLGMESVLDGLELDGGGSTVTIEYKPTLKFYGEAPDKEELTEALALSQEQFDSMMDRYWKTRSRMAFG